jgi:hypothetical protein
VNPDSANRTAWIVTVFAVMALIVLIAYTVG